jgi:hypothetical protein
MSMKMAGALKMKLNLSMNSVCCICSCNFEPGTNVTFLGCHPKHAIHEYCYESLMKFFKEDADCPLCRTKVDPAKVVTKPVEPNLKNIADGNAVAASDPFGLDE